MKIIRSIIDWFSARFTKFKNQRAPYGYEDDAGFHIGKEPGT